MARAMLFRPGDDRCRIIITKVCVCRWHILQTSIHLSPCTQKKFSSNIRTCTCTVCKARYPTIFLPHMNMQGVKWFVFVCYHLFSVVTIISRLWDLDIWASWMCHQTVENGKKKLAFNLLWITYKPDTKDSISLILFAFSDPVLIKVELWLYRSCGCT